MKLKLLTFILLELLIQILFIQSELLTVKANSISAIIKDDNNFLKNTLNIVPDANSDFSKKPPLYTDIDSISFVPKQANDNVTAKNRIVWQQSRLGILRSGQEYNYSDMRYIPKFSYQSQHDPNLIKIRKDLKLDSIAGNGTELCKIFNLMHWVHNIVEHDGSSINPTLKNAIDLVKVCQTEHRGVNCRMMATILNECYLSLGIKSRYVTCMPRETDFDDCHVINMVYSTELKKWIWIDPTFDAYVMDDKGNLLGIQEVRKRLIEGKPLVLNADANWNRINLETKEHYLNNYMAKNLYRFETPLISEYNSETWIRGRSITYVELLPLDGIEQSPQKRVEVNNTTGVIFRYYKTNNPDLFWARP